MARSVDGEALWRRQVALRREAMAPLKAALVREGRSQTWLLRELKARVRISLSVSLLRAYLNGYARIPQRVLSAACWIAGVQESAITVRVDDEALLIQQPRTRKQRRKTASA